MMLLADDPPIDPTTGHGPEWGKAAPVALLIIVLMGVALFLLIKSMNRQLRKVPTSFVAEPDAAAVEAPAEQQVSVPADPESDQPAVDPPGKGPHA